MSWRIAERLIRQHIVQGIHLDLDSFYKIVLEVPPHSCYKNGFDGATGFKVKVGNKSTIEVPLKMLEKIYGASVSNTMLYNRDIFKGEYNNLLKIKPCYVHVVGKILLEAKIADQPNSRNYILRSL